MTLSLTQMQSIIGSGGSVELPDRIVTGAAQLPSDQATLDGIMAVYSARNATIGAFYVAQDAAFRAAHPWAN